MAAPAPAPSIPHHLSGMVSNPTLTAAAAAGVSMFPTPTVMANPNSYLAIHEPYAAGAAVAAAAAAAQHQQPQQQQQQQQGTAQPPGGMVMPRMGTMIGNQVVANGFNGATGGVHTQPAQSGIAPAPSTTTQRAAAAAAAAPVASSQAPNGRVTMPPGTMLLQAAPPGHTNGHHALQPHHHTPIHPQLNPTLVSHHPQPGAVGTAATAATATTLGGVHIPALPPNASTAMQVQVAAAAAAAAAAPLKTVQTTKGKSKKEEKTNSSRSRRTDLTPAERAQQNRDRNREHARSTRLRKKAYVQKLKELVEGLHAERTEEARKRRVAVQHLADVQGVRRAVVRSFLKFHSSYESDPRKWMTILEDNFWFKQPVTPYRSFPRAEIEQVSTKPFWSCSNHD